MSLDDISNETIRQRISLATEIILSSGLIDDDVRAGIYDSPDPGNQDQQWAFLLAMTVIVGGIDGTTQGLVASAFAEMRFVEAAAEGLLRAVDEIKANAKQTREEMP